MLLRSFIERLRERQVTAALYWVLLLVLIVLLYITWRNLNRAQEASDRIRKYNQIIMELDGLFGLMRDQETGTRGYLLSKDPDYEVPFNTADPWYWGYRYQLDSLYAGERDPTFDSLLVLSYEMRLVWRDLRGRSDTTRILRPRDADALQKAKERMDLARTMYTRLVARARRDRDAYLATERNEPFNGPMAVLMYAIMAIAVTALLFWRLSRALYRTEKTKIDLDVKVADLHREVRKRATLQQTLQNVLDTSPSGIMTLRAVRSESGVIEDLEWTSSNESANALLGRKDLVGKRMLIESPAEKDLGLFTAYVRVVETSEHFVDEVHRDLANGSKHLAYHAVKLGDGLVVTFSDVTEQRRAEEINSEADKLALTAQITRTVAHEVRNPLTNIQLAVEQLQDELQDRKEITSPLFAIIERNLRRIGTLIKEMLESSSIRELRRSPISMRDICASSMDAVADRLQLHGASASIEVSQGLPMVVVDRELIDLAITNIAVNAIEAMEPGKGRLRFVARMVGDEIVLEIIDNGKGIPASNIQRLFEPFYTGKPGGLGLGLTTARTILINHGIIMDIRSQVGQGTTFVLRFPEGLVAN